MKKIETITLSTHKVADIYERNGGGYAVFIVQSYNDNDDHSDEARENDETDRQMIEDDYISEQLDDEEDKCYE